MELTRSITPAILSKTDPEGNPARETSHPRPATLGPPQPELSRKRQCCVKMQR